MSVAAPDGQSLGIAGARVRLSGAPLGSSSLATFSDAQGDYEFVGLAPGSYKLDAGFQGFTPFVKDLSIPAQETLVEDIRLEIEELRESVTVQAEAEGIATTEAAPAAEIKQDTLQTVPLVNERFTEALPLIPGVVRGPDGLLNVKGARASQSGLVVNSANVTDPVTGEYAINLPIDVVQSLQVLTNPYAPEYGKFTGGITSIETRRGTDKWRVQLTNFFPRVRRRDGDFVGLGSVTPRLAFGGPMKKDKVNIFQALEYRFVRTEVEVESFPPLQRDKKLESFDSFTQLDWEINALNHFTTTFSLFPQKLGFVNLDTFNPQAVTANFKQRGFFWGINEKMVLANGSLLESYFSIKQFDANIFPSSGNGIMNLAPDVNSGNFFNRQDRESMRYEALGVYNLAPLQFAGSHLMKVGAGVNYNTFDGRNLSSAVRILRANGTRSAEIDFAGGGELGRNKTEALTYVQDKWGLTDRLTLEYGLRFDRDTIADENNFAPRLGFAFLPILDDRTVIRGGVGLFYDKTSFNVATFEQLQERVLTRFGPDGNQLIGFSLPQRLALDKGQFRTPRSVNWNIEFDREWVKNLFIRVGYQQREGRREYLLNPVEDSTPGSMLLLGNGGRSRYKEFQVTARFRFRPASEIVASYTRSAATGDLNDFNSFFGNFENPIIRPNERSRLPWDAPNRFLFWGDMTFKYGITVSPVLDVHDGFPLSFIDEDRNFVGARNRAGRFPTFASLDLQVTKRITIPFIEKKFRVGVKVFNLTNHFNPRDF
ncbi:MAG: TonB-dependent receptor, partial [Acidobacteria bacterium]|nr:TonB-dependent receptor [Acidobacteriota bacterium]